MRDWIFGKSGNWREYKWRLQVKRSSGRLEYPLANFETKEDVERERLIG